MPRSHHVGPRKVIAVGVLGLWLVWSCSNSDKERIQAAGISEGCTLNSDCRDPLVCTFTRCHEECKTDRDCPGEQRCVKGDDGQVCQLKLETDCSKKASICQGAQTCGADGECRDVCLTIADCTTGQVCAASGECASTVTTKDLLSASGEILTDPFVDPADGAGGKAGGTGGAANTSATGGAPVAGAPSATGGALPGTGGSYSPSVTGGAAGTAVMTAGAAPVATGGTLSVAGASGKSAASGASGTIAAAGALATGGRVGTGGAIVNVAGSGAIICPAGKGDCDSNPNDCETDLTLITSCGKCNVACDPTHGAVRCDASTLTCVVNTEAGGCTTGYADCNKIGTDGCEASLATDANNCGVCGRSCGGGKCTSSQCGAAVVFDPTGVTTLSYSYNAPAFLVGAQIIKLNTANGTEIRTSTLPPTNPVSQGAILATSTTAVYEMAVDATNVYYSIAGSPATILYKPLSATASTAAKTAVNMPDTNYARAIASNSTAFYIAAAASGGQQILTAAKTLGAQASTAAPLPGITARSTIDSLVVGGSYLFWVESPNMIVAAPLGGGTPVVVDATIQSGYYSYVRLTTDGSYVYWNTYNGASSKIRRISLAVAPSSTAVEDVAIGVSSPSTGLAVDDAYVYFFSSFQVYRVVKDGSLSVESLANLNSAPYFYNLFGVDAEFVYGVGSGGQVVRVAKGTLSQ